MVHLKKLYEKYNKQGLEILGISYDKDRETLVDYIRMNRIPWPQLFCGDLGKERCEALMQVTGIRGIPRYFVIDQKGNLFTDKGRRRLDEIVDELLDS